MYIRNVLVILLRSNVFLINFKLPQVNAISIHQRYVVTTRSHL